MERQRKYPIVHTTLLCKKLGPEVETSLGGGEGEG